MNLRKAILINNLSEGLLYVKHKKHPQSNSHEFTLTRALTVHEQFLVQNVQSGFRGYIHKPWDDQNSPIQNKTDQNDSWVFSP